jgi:PAS domain S-box-containing protein
MDEHKTREQLEAELAELRRQIAELETAEAEHQQTEETLRLLSSAVEQSSEGLAVSDLEGNLTFVNEAFATMHGYSVEELAGKHLAIFHTPEQLPSVETANQQIQETGEFNGEIWHVRRDGTVFLTLMHNSLLRNEMGNPIGMVGTLRDITERKQAEEALRRRAQELDLLQETVLDITTPHELSTLLQTIVERAALLLNTVSGGMYLCRPERRETHCVVSYNTPHDYTGTVLKYGEGAAGVVAQTGEPLIVDNYRTWSRRAAAYEEEQPFTAILSAPMIWQGQVTGVIHVLDDAKNRRFTQANLELLTLFANHAAIAVENARLYEHAQQELAQRKQAEEALRESEERWHTLAELTSDIAYAVRVEPDGTTVPEWEIGALTQITGFTYDELIARGDWPSLVHPDDMPLALQHLQLHLSGQPDVSEYRIIAKNGETRWLRDYGHPVWDYAEGRVVRIIGAAQDITERKRVEEELRQQTSQLEAVREVGLKLIAQLDLDTLLHSIVSWAVELLGGTGGGLYLYRPDQDVLEWVVSIGPTAAPAGVILRRGEGLSGKILDTGKPAIVNDYRHWEGRSDAWEDYSLAAGVSVPVRWGQEFLGVLNVNAMTTGAFSPADAELLSLLATQAAIAIRNARLYEAVQHELTERKQAAEALRDSEEKYRALAENSPVGIFISDAERFIYANQRLCKITGFSRDDILNRPDPVGTLLAPEERERVLTYAQSRLVGASAPSRYTVRGVRKGGEEISLEFVVSSILLSGKRVLQGTVKDITEQVQAEEQIKVSLREKEILLQEIHHRVKNNLAVVSGLLAFQFETIQDEQARAAFQESQNRIRAMSQVHEQLYRSRDLARVDMAEYVQGVMGYLGRSYGVRAAALKIDVTDVALDIGTAIPCGLIINELVSNALKHAFPPDWEKPASKENEICINLRLDKDKYKLTISDNGTGLPADWKLEEQKTLGLRLVNLLTRQLEGALQVDKEGGTAFCLTFAIPEERDQNNDE